MHFYFVLKLPPVSVSVLTVTLPPPTDRHVCGKCGLTYMYTEAEKAAAKAAGKSASGGGAKKVVEVKKVETGKKKKK